MPFDGGPAQRKPRDGFWLTLGLCVLLPASGLALKYWGHLFFAPDQPAPLIEVGDRSQAAAPGPSGLSLVKPEPQAAEPAPRSSLDLLAKEPLGESEPAPAAPAALPQTAAPKAPEQARRAYPKLRKNNGWRSWYQQGGSGYTYMPAQDAPQMETAPKSSLGNSAALSSAGSGSIARPPAAAATAPATAARRGYQPPPVIYQASSEQTEVGPAGPAAELKVKAGPRTVTGNGTGRPDYTTFVGDPDTIPRANPEGPRANGSCPHAGWWKSNYDGRCYETKPMCDAADYAHQGCVQP